MKFKVQMKDPDTLIDAIEDAVNELTFPDLDEDEVREVREKRKEKTLELCGKWFKYSEYLTVEIDTETKTCVVVGQNK